MKTNPHIEANVTRFMRKTSDLFESKNFQILDIGYCTKAYLSIQLDVRLRIFGCFEKKELDLPGLEVNMINTVEYFDDNHRNKSDITIEFKYTHAYTHRLPDYCTDLYPLIEEWVKKCYIPDILLVDHSAIIDRICTEFSKSHIWTTHVSVDVLDLPTIVAEVSIVIPKNIPAINIDLDIAKEQGAIHESGIVIIIQKVSKLKYKTMVDIMFRFRPELMTLAELKTMGRDYEISRKFIDIVSTWIQSNFGWA